MIVKLICKECSSGEIEDLQHVYRCKKYTVLQNISVEDNLNSNYSKKLTAVCDYRKTVLRRKKKEDLKPK